jgi:hypothetical protein
MAGALALVPISAAVSNAQNPAPSPSPTPPPAQPAPSPLAQALTEVAKVRFGEYLAPEQHAKLQSNMEALTATAGRLRSVKLKNADEPDFVFGV